MGRPYDDELNELASTFEWALRADAAGLIYALRRAAHLPLVAVGSGGALTVATTLVGLHHEHAGALALTATPLQVDTALPRDGRASVWILSASGKNEDIRAALRTVTKHEPQHVVVLCGAADSPLAREASAYGWVDTVAIDLPTRDGFLAVNSVLAFITLAARCYVDVHGGTPLAPGLSALIERSFPGHASIADQSAPLWERATTVVLHGATTIAAAMDLESRFTEAALGSAQIADYRNFAHGRHHWLAKRGTATSVVSMSGPSIAERKLAKNTLRVLPPEIPALDLTFGGSFEDVALSSVIASMLLAGEAGRARGIDPGRPGVPEFGRRLYHMKTPEERASLPRNLSARRASAIERKAGRSPVALQTRGLLETWIAALDGFEERLSSAHLGAVAIDFDGTMKEGADRLGLPRKALAKEIERLLANGLMIGIATGRGDSVLEPLRRSFDQKLWNRVLVGYHNGSVVRTLDEAPPTDDDVIATELLHAQRLLEEDASLRGLVKLRPHRRQLTVMATRPLGEDELWHLVAEVVRRGQVEGMRIVRSSHSVDVLTSDVSKLRLVEELKHRVSAEVLCIGDRGRWPGNDFEMLETPVSLSVDEVSPDPTTGWNIAPAGVRGVDALLLYLSEIETSGSTVAARYRLR